MCNKHSNLEDDFNAIFMFKCYIVKLLANIRAKRKQKELSVSYLITKVYNNMNLVTLFYSISETELEEGIYSQKQSLFHRLAMFSPALLLSTIKTFGVCSHGWLRTVIP